MARDLNRIDDGGIRHYDLRREDLMLRALRKGMHEYKVAYGRYPKSFAVTTISFDDMVSKFPANPRGTTRIFFGMTMRANDNIGLTNDQFEYMD